MEEQEHCCCVGEQQLSQQLLHTKTSVQMFSVGKGL